MKRRHLLSTALGAALLTGALMGCSAEATYEVGTGEGSVGTTAASEAPVVEVQSTAIPSSWPSDIPTPPGGVVENVIVLDETISVTWLAPLDDIYELASSVYDGFGENACSERTSDVTDSYGRINCKSDTYSVTIDITPLSKDQAQVLATYEPLQ